MKNKKKVKKKKRAHQYKSKLAIKGTLDEVLKAALLNPAV